MPNHASPKKALKQNIKKTLINKARKTRIANAIKQVLSAVSSNNVSEADIALKNAESIIMKGAGKGILKKNTASRKVSRLSAKVKAIKNK